MEHITRGGLIFLKIHVGGLVKGSKTDQRFLAFQQLQNYC